MYQGPGKGGKRTRTKSNEGERDERTRKEERKTGDREFSKKRKTGEISGQNSIEPRIIGK